MKLLHGNYAASDKLIWSYLEHISAGEWITMPPARMGKLIDVSTRTVFRSYDRLIAGGALRRRLEQRGSVKLTVVQVVQQEEQRGPID